jgi:hypothetical protein
LEVEKRFSRKASSSAIPAQDRDPAVNKPSQPSDEEAQRQAHQSLRQSVAFAQIVSLLMRSPLYRHFAIADLEWLVIPPLAMVQFYCLLPKDSDLWAVCLKFARTYFQSLIVALS